MAANYNNSAWFYDGLSRFVYGQALINAQVYLIEHVPPGSKVLIAGGGTGWILDELIKIHPYGLQIIYAEISANMMARSQKRNTGQNQVTFINNAIENLSLPADFDVVITPFLLDNFVEQTLNTVFGHIHSLLKPQGLWLNASFQLSGKWWQKVLLKTMFIFFKILCHIEAGKLPDIEKHFISFAYLTLDKKTFFGNFIAASVYKKR